MNRRRSFLVWLSGAALCATLLVANLLWTARVEALAAAQVTALNYARTLEVRLDATFRRTDSILQTLAAQVPPAALRPQAEAGYAAEINPQLDRLKRDFDELIALRAIDIGGEQRYVTEAATTPAANYADRVFFGQLRDELERKVNFSEVLTGRVSRKPTVVMSRSLRDAEGRFYGALLAPIDLSYFQQQFRKLDIGESGVVFLRRSDNTQLVLRWPPLDAEVNKPMPAGHAILAALRAGQTESVNQYVAFTDGVTRLSGTVAVKGYPFFLTVALSTDDVLSGWRKLAWLTGLIWAVLLAAMLALTLTLRRSDAQRASLEARLRESQRLESLGTLAGGIAHDFNNIVGAILGNVALAAQDLDAQHPAQRSLEQIRKAGRRARELVQQILAFGRRQAQSLVSQPLQPLVDECAALVRSTLPAAVTLKTQFDTAPLHARVDATQIQQVMMNLCTNALYAVAARGADGGQVEIGLEAVTVAAGDAPRPGGPELPPGRYVHLWVRDNGTGMDAQVRARIFEPFFTTKATGTGTGLGLSVVHGIVTAHGGQLGVESEPGLGTTLHLHLPATDPPAEAHEAAPPAAPPATPARGSGHRVLYVDDDEVMRLLVERLLERLGYAVTGIGDGDAAIAWLQAQPQAVDIVVTDFNMPGTDGLEVAQAVAALRPGLPVVISSGFVSDELRRAAAAAGVRALLHKQHTLEELGGLVASLLAPGAGAGGRDGPAR